MAGGDRESSRGVIELGDGDKFARSWRGDTNELRCPSRLSARSASHLYFRIKGDMVCGQGWAQCYLRAGYWRLSDAFLPFGVM